jgi:hypothetical protein
MTGGEEDKVGDTGGDTVAVTAAGFRKAGLDHDSAGTLKRLTIYTVFERRRHATIPQATWF